MIKQFIEQLRLYLRGLASEPTVLICASTALLIISHYQGSTGYVREVFGARFDKTEFSNTVGHFWWFACSLFLYLVVPLVLSFATKGSFHRAYGFGLGDKKAGFTISALFIFVMLPLVWWVSHFDAFKGIYPLAGGSAFNLTREGKQVPSWGLFLAYETGYFLYFVGWEFLFRGWLVNGLLPYFGRVGAILIPVAPFAVMHLGKAEIEALGSIIAGIALGILALRTRSFWYGAFVHGCIAVFMDCLVVIPQLP